MSQSLPIRCAEQSGSEQSGGEPSGGEPSGAIKSDEDTGDETGIDESCSTASTSSTSTSEASAVVRPKKSKSSRTKKPTSTTELNVDTTDHYPTYDEQVSICLESCSASMTTLKRRFIRCSAQATIVHLKKFIAKKLLDRIDKYGEIDILCNGESLGKEHTLKFVYITRWRYQNPPLLLQYRPFEKKSTKNGK